MRFFTSAGLLCALAVPVAHAQQPTANERAYTVALMCSVVAAHYASDADIHRTADALRRMARVLGHDSRKTAADVVQMANVLGSEMRSDPASMDRTRTACRRAGLVG